ncbi:hypothetical protein EV424DRAFT_1353740 [Suillus variegatus]|nr:hypothetical protein EV424DRAFT_1353740 [Suillus variegatus]
MNKFQFIQSKVFCHNPPKVHRSAIGNCTGTGNPQRVAGRGTAGYGRSVAILRLGAFTVRACGACRVDSRWGVGGIRAAKLNSIVIPPLHPLIHCAHPLVSRAPSCTSGTPSRTSQTSTLSYIACTLSYILHTSLMAPIHPLVHPVHALMSPSPSILVRAKAMLIRVIAHRSQLVSPLILVRARAMLIRVVAHHSQTTTMRDIQTLCNGN